MQWSIKIVLFLSTDITWFISSSFDDKMNCFHMISIEFFDALKLLWNNLSIVQIIMVFYICFYQSFGFSHKIISIISCLKYPYANCITDMRYCFQFVVYFAFFCSAPTQICANQYGDRPVLYRDKPVLIGF